MKNFLFFCFTIILLTSCVSKPRQSTIEIYQLSIPVKSGQAKKIVLIGGCFDVLHYGHIEFLRKSKDHGDYLVVALESDEMIIKYKKRQPIHNQQQRAQNLAAIRYVDKVLLLPVLEGFKGYNQLVQDVKPVIIATTKNDSQINNKKRQALSVGAQVKIVIDNINDFSSSNIIKSMSK